MSKSLFQGLEHIGIKTREIEKATQFYTEVLGFEFVKRIKPRDAELVFLKQGETVIELVEITDGKVLGDGVVNHIALRVTNIFEAVEWLKQNDVELLQTEPQPMGEERYNLFFRGPSGERLELYQGA